MCDGYAAGDVVVSPTHGKVQVWKLAGIRSGVIYKKVADQLRQQRSMMVDIVHHHWYNHRIMWLFAVDDGGPCYNQLISFRRQQRHLRRHHPWRQYK